MAAFLAVLIIAALLVAFANGANDNAKGIATLVGTRVANFRSAIRWANLTTFAGSVAAIPMALFVNSMLLKSFGGADLLPQDFRIDADYLLAVGLAAALTVLMATRLGLPISTTHSLIGALVGAGLVAVGPQRLAWYALASRFAAPLLFSPVLAGGATLALFPLARRLMQFSSVEKTLCLCVESAYVPVVEHNGAMILVTSGRTLTVDEIGQCETRFAGTIFTFSAARALAAGQFITGGLVSFARGLNDTPKIAGILLAAGTLGLAQGPAGRLFGVAPVVGSVALAMLLGGLLFTRRVARTMSEKITAMDGEQGSLASLVTAALVVLASFIGLPVSTTHVTVGSLFGIGVANGTARLNTIAVISVAWVITLPIAALLAAVAYTLLKL